MANYREDIVDIDLKGGNIHRSFMRHTIGEGDENADRFGVRVFRNGTPEALMGSCYGLFVNAAGGTVTISNGTISGNTAYVILPEACYAVEGVFSLAIKVTTTNNTATLRIVDGVVSRTSTDTIVDPGTLVSSIDDLIQEIEDAIASIPPDYSELLDIVKGAKLTDSDMEEGEYSTFLEIPYGDYLCYFEDQTVYGFPARLGSSFYLHVSDKGSNDSYAYKTFYAYSNNGAAMFSVAGSGASALNLPKWYGIDESKTGLDSASMTAAGYTNFVDIPQGTYDVYLTEAGTFGFPTAIGQSFVLEVSSQRLSTYAYVKWTAYGNNGTALYAVGGGSTSSANPPAWYYLTSNNGGSSMGGVNKFDDPLATVKLLLLGDSITQGAGATDLSNPITLTISGLPDTTKTIYQDGSSWAGLLKAYIEEEYPNVSVLNHGWGKINLNQMASHMDDLVPNDTTHCIIGLGVNSEGQTSFDGPIATIINYLLDKGIKVYAWTSWVGSHAEMSNINTAGRVQAALIRAYRNAGIEPLCVYSIAKRYIDENELDPEEYMQPDSLVHPNDLGHLILFRIIREGFGF